MTFFYGEFTLGGVSNSQEIQIIICGSETFTASGEETFFFYATDSYDGEAIEWAVYQTYFTYTGADECRVVSASN